MFVEVTEEKSVGGLFASPHPESHMPRSPSFCSFASFLIVLLTSLFNKSDFSKYLTIYMIFFFPLFEMTSAVIPDL